MNDVNNVNNGQVQNLRWYRNILVVEIILITVLAIANIIAGVIRSSSKNTTRVSITNICDHSSKDAILNFIDNITKEEAIAIVEEIHSKDSCVLNKFMPEGLKLRSDEYKQRMLYSYDDVSEVPGIAKDSVMGLDVESADDFMIDETTDYYTIVSVNPSKVPCGELDEYMSTISCYRGISFNRKYLNHYEKVEGSSHNDEIIFNDLSSDFVELVLKIIMVTENYWGNWSLYDYYFEDNGDNYSLTGVYFGVGVDMNNIEGASAFDIPYAINIYAKKIIVDKSTKKITWEKYISHGEEVSSQDLKSIPLSEDDLIKIQAMLYGLSDDEVEELKAQRRDEDEMTDTEMLEARVSAICGKDYTVVFKASDNSGIFKCNDYTNAIYSISNPDRTEENYKRLAFATFLGTDDDEIANEFFNDKLYIYQNYRHSEIPDQLILLLENSSEESLVKDNLDAIYNYIKKLNEDYATDLVLSVFYTDSLNQTNSLKDYVIISGAAGFYSWLPNGNGFGNYYYQAEKEVAGLNKLGENPDLYSSQTRDAIKFHRHIRAEIKDGRSITKESLRQLLYNSFEDGL